MSDLSGFAGTMLKKVEYFPFYFWNIFGVGLFYLFSLSNFDLKALSSAYPLEILVVFSLLTSAIINIVLMVFVGVLHKTIEQFTKLRDFETHDLFMIAGFFSLGLSLIIFSLNVPSGLVFFAGLLLVILLPMWIFFG